MFKEPLINYAISLAYRLIHNQDAALKACLGLVKSSNAECESACKPRRASPEAHIYGIALLIKYFGHSLRSTLCICTIQVSQRHGMINQRLLRKTDNTLKANIISKSIPLLLVKLVYTIELYGMIVKHHVNTSCECKIRPDSEIEHRVPQFIPDKPD